jgi:hypothetical protein
MNEKKYRALAQRYLVKTKAVYLFAIHELKLVAIESILIEKISKYIAPPKESFGLRSFNDLAFSFFSITI